MKMTGKLMYTDTGENHMNIMYEYQHVALPDWIYNSPEFFSDIINYTEQRVLYESCKRFFEDNGVVFPYQKDDFGGFCIRVDRDTVMIMLRFPEPQEVPLCTRMYIYVDTHDSHMACYSVEKGVNLYGPESVWDMCSWDENGNHNNYGSHDVDDYAVATIREMRFFYALFHGIEGAEIPELLMYEKRKYREFECPNCHVLMAYDTGRIKQGNHILFQCPKCMRIFYVRLDEDGFAILNNTDL